MNSSDQRSVLIVAPSGRALAATARRAGYRPLVADLFDDLDTRALATANILIGASDHGFAAADLIDPLLRLAETYAPIGLVYGGGFEDRPRLIAELAQHFTIYGNPPETVTRVKDPQILADLCCSLTIPHPEISFERPGDPTSWLVKRAGAGGGLHVALSDSRSLGPRDYYQRRVEGRPVSALLLGDGCRICLLGFSEQWPTANSATPFRFGGALRPARLSASLSREITTAAETIAGAVGLVGLNSIDFLVGNESFHLLEINPRPGATLDIFADREGRLFAAHLDACRGQLPRRPLVFMPAAASAIFYTPFDLTSMPALEWPDWCQDRQKAETCLRKGDPVCTVTAKAETPAAAWALVNERLVLFQKYLTDCASKEAAA